MPEITAADLRAQIGEAIASGIDLHRSSREGYEDLNYVAPSGPPTDEEITDFLLHNPLLDAETVEQLVDPGLLGFSSKRANATDSWLQDFSDAIYSWADNQSWLAADEAFGSWIDGLAVPEPDTSNFWKQGDTAPGWFKSTPSYLLIAHNLLQQGQLLSEMHWREFEELIGSLLETDGWNVAVTQATRDGGLDVVAEKLDPQIGTIHSVWQAKKYSPKHKVKLAEVRELSAVRDDKRATKGMIVTTSSLTKDAVDWVKRDIYRLGYKDHDQIAAWLKGKMLR